MSDRGGHEEEEYGLLYAAPRSGHRGRIPRSGRKNILIIFMAVMLVLMGGAAFLWTRDSEDSPTLISPEPSTTNPGHEGLEDEKLIASPTSSPPQQPTTTPHASKPTKGDYKAEIAELVKGPATVGFRENLRNDTQYITTWVSGGWTNDFMTYINLIYLSTLTERTPVIPPFNPSHVSWEGGFLPFGDVFDVPRLAKDIKKTVLEWRDVKQEKSDHVEELGCWSIWDLTGGDHTPRGSAIPFQALRLDVAYTSLPESSVIIHDLWVPFWTLAKLSFSDRRNQALSENPHQTPNGADDILPPDEQMMCFDFMYFVGAQDNDEWWFEWSPAWRFVGKYARWNEKLQMIAVSYIQRALGVEEDGVTVPKYISVHVRHGDFTAACGTEDPQKCFHPLSDYASRVAAIAARLHERGIVVEPNHILVTSDERSPDWWAQVRGLGWKYTDHVHEQTEERYGLWYPPLIDAVAQSLAVGFVGTEHSTMSLVAMRRVEDWNGGIGDLVPIGFPSRRNKLKRNNRL